MITVQCDDVPPVPRPVLGLLLPPPPPALLLLRAEHGGVGGRHLAAAGQVSCGILRIPGRHYRHHLCYRGIYIATGLKLIYIYILLCQRELASF